ncbi:MAG: (d)CMP kinase [Nocardioidaceae bacterium]|nr:(d)CMP kinase [Nocardioidaceae bacterium]
MTVLALVDLAAALASSEPRAGTTRVVAVDGPSGSGKTTLARRLRRHLRCRSIHMDALYPGWDGLAAAPGLLVGGVLRPLAEGRPAAFRRWHWGEGRWAESHDVRPAPVLLVEGVGSGALACAPYLSTLLWVEAPTDERFRRGMERDGDTYRPHWQRWAAQEAVMFAADGTRGRADVVVDGASTETHDPATQVVLLAGAVGPPHQHHVARRTDGAKR